MSHWSYQDRLQMEAQTYAKSVLTVVMEKQQQSDEPDWVLPPVSSVSLHAQTRRLAHTPS